MKKVLITDHVDQSLIEGLEELGYHCDYDPDISLRATRKIIVDYDGVVINSKIHADADFISSAYKLKFIARLGSGLDIIDLDMAKRHDIHVISAPEGNRNAVAEHALGMLLSLMNNLSRADRQVRKYDWQREINRGVELSGKTLGIIGFGNTGSLFAKKLSSMNVRVLAYDKYKSGFAKNWDHVQEVTVDAMFDCDIVSFHVPLTEETFHFCDRSFLDNCKPGVIIINTSRGKVVKIEDLVESLNSGIVGGACLDVFENENPESYSVAERRWYDKLFSFENTIFSPHIAGWTVESRRKIAQTILTKLKSKL